MKIKAVLLSKVRLIKVNFQMKIRILNWKKKKEKERKEKSQFAELLMISFAKFV